MNDTYNIPICNFTQAESWFSDATKFNSEKILCKHLEDKLPFLIKTVYGLDITEIHREYVFDYFKYGFSKCRVDFWINTKQGKDILIEAKNPTFNMRENIQGLAQMMTYKMILEYFGKDAILIYATSVFNFLIIKFIYDYKLPFDLFTLNQNSVAYFSYKDLSK